MALLRLKNIFFHYGGPWLLEDVSLEIEAGERVGLLGRNGAGKSTVLKLLDGSLQPDQGKVLKEERCRVAWLPQEVPPGQSGTVREVVARGLGASGVLAARHGELSARLATEVNPRLLRELEGVQQALEAGTGWEDSRAVEETLTRMELPGEASFASLSAGMKRRVFLAQALVCRPDLLLLDEPTNHLDLGAIEWLENFLSAFPGALVFVTHDRFFLQRLATRIVEVDRARLTGYRCGFQEYLRRREAALEAEARQQAAFDKKLAQEEVWIRKGVKERRKRNEGRVRALLEMRNQRQARRERLQTAEFEIQSAARSGDLVLEAQNVAFSYPDRPVIQGLSTAVLRGDKLGIIGPNGSGKTTLLRLLLGELAPSSGQLRLGTRLKVAYFDQLRGGLDESQSVLANVGQGSESVVVNGQARHVLGYLQDFLFTPDRARSAVRDLSGGERNRLLLAKLFTRPANLLVLDEPTNDLDAETLELLEERLCEFDGTVLLVSHDRAFLNNVVSGTLVLEGGGVVKEYAGGYDDYLRARKAQAPLPGSARPAKDPGSAPAARAAPLTDSPSPARPRKLSYKERLELEKLPARIEELEEERRRLEASLADPASFRKAPAEIQAAKARFLDLEGELASAYQRWEELESISQSV